MATRTNQNNILPNLPISPNRSYSERSLRISASVTFAERKLARFCHMRVNLEVISKVMDIERRKVERC